MLALTLNTGVSNAQWSKLILDRVGGFDNDIKEVRVYYDANNVGSWDPKNTSAYLLVTSTGQSFGLKGTVGQVALNFVASQAVGAASKTFFIVIDVSSTALPSDSLAVRILNGGYLTVDSPNTVAAFSAQSGPSVVTQQAALMTVTASTGVLPAVVRQGDFSVPFVRFDLRMNKYAGQWTKLTVTQGGTAADTDISKVRLYLAAAPQPLRRLWRSCRRPDFGRRASGRRIRFTTHKDIFISVFRVTGREAPHGDGGCVRRWTICLRP